MLVRPNLPALNPESTMRRFLLALPAALFAAACADHAPVAPQVSYKISSPPPSARAITVMTQNLYVGADVDLVIRALGTPDPNDDFAALLAAIETVGKTAYPARAEAIADEIARAQPHAVGLQEVSDIDIDLRPLGVPIEVHQHFLQILQDALARRGLNYRVAAIVTDVNASLVGGLVSLVDHDALLVDGDRVDGRSERHTGLADVSGPGGSGVRRHVGRAATRCGGTDVLPRRGSLRFPCAVRSAHRLRLDAGV